MSRAWLIAGPATVLLLGVAFRLMPEPNRCPPGAVAIGPHCCGVGQGVDCAGAASACPATLVLDRGECIPPPTRISFPDTTLTISTSDWEGAGAEHPREVTVPAFAIDAYEFTPSRLCDDCPAAPRGRRGIPLADISAEEAARLCAERGGALPTVEQHAVAAGAARGNRYPWGPTGVVCLRIAFGLADGPCGSGAARPDLVGMRPAGATPEGVFDLAGNVSEWALGPEGRVFIRGGSFRDIAANRFRTWSTLAHSGQATGDVGFRCVYPR